MDHHLGEAYARVWASQFVMSALDGRTIHIDGRVGHIVVVVPDRGLGVQVDATIDGAGETELFDHQEHGSDSASHSGGADAPHVNIDADLVFGQIEVRTEATR